MLLSMQIRDFVLVDALEVEFRSGLTVLTGETGAGKSLLVDALSLVMGGRADAGVIRQGAQRAEIAAWFDTTGLTVLQQWLIEQEMVDSEGNGTLCMLRRIIDGHGRSRCYINGCSATVAQLREAGEWLVDLHGQHAHQSLMKLAFQRDMLDAYAGAVELAERVASHHREYADLMSRIEAVDSQRARQESEREHVRWQLDELTALRFDVAEWETLQADHAMLAHVAELQQGTAVALEVLSEREDSVLSSLQMVSTELQRLSLMDERMAEYVVLLASAQAEIDEVAHGVRHYADRLEGDPARLAEIEQRMAQIVSTAKKYREKPEHLAECLQRIQQKWQSFEQAGDVAELRKRADAVYCDWLESVQKLTLARQVAARSLSADVSQMMQQLALTGGRFDVALTPLSDAGGHGAEQVEFLVAPHEGVTAKSLAKTASGGELSRISLALQTVLGQAAAVPVLVFDEVDVGIGGGVAEAVGRLLRALGQQRQVLCITHLPQVAAQGEQHWQVSKRRHADGSVLSQLHDLTREERVEEIARMLGGEVLTDTTRLHAREMLVGASVAAAVAEN